MIVEAAGLGRSYGDRSAVSGVEIAIGAGERVALIGRNGAGKTTLLSLLAGTLAPSAGSVRLAAGASVGWVPQQPALYRRLTVAENLRLFASLHDRGQPHGNRGDPARAVQEMLDQSGLASRAGELAGRLSGGGRQRLNIAIGLLGGPALMLLDEPSASLDPLQRERMWEFLGALAGDGAAILFSTHDLGEAARYAGRIVAIDGGVVRADVPVAALQTSPAGIGAALSALLVDEVGRADGPGGR